MRPILAAVAVSMMTIFGLLALGGTAQAQSPDQQGWWTAINPGLAQQGLPVALPSAPPDIPSNGLLVEGGMSDSSPTAFAALVYNLADGGSVSSLTLTVAPNSGTTPDSTLEICPLKATTIVAEQGGPMSDAPAYQCSHKVTASPGSSGSSYKFDASTLVSNGALAVAILPSSPTDRVVLSQPDGSSLAVQAGSAGGAGGTAQQGSSSAPAGGNLSPSGGDLSPSGGISPFGTQSSDSPGLATLPGASASTNPSSNPQSGGSGPTESSAFPAVPSSLVGGPAKPRDVGLAILVLLAGAAAWSGAGRAAIRAVVAGEAGRKGENELGSSL